MKKFNNEEKDNYLIIIKERINIGFTILKNEMINTKNKIDIRKEILDEISKKIFLDLKCSENFYKLILNFFEKIDFKILNKINLEEKLKIQEKNSLEKNENKKLVKLILEFNSDFSILEKKFEKLKSEIEQKIIKKKLIKIEDTKKKELNKLIKKMEIINKNLKKLEIENIEKMKLIKINEIMYKKNFEIFERPKINYFEKIMECIILIKKIKNVVKDSGKTFFEIFEKFCLLKNSQNIAIEKSIKSYIKLINEFFNTPLNFEKTKSLINLINFEKKKNLENEIKIFLNKDQENIILKLTKSEIFEKKVFFYFFQNIDISEFENTYEYFLYKSLNFKGCIKNLFFKNTKIIIFFTIDFHISIFEAKNELPEKIFVSEKIENIELKINLKKKEVVIKFLDKGFFWDKIENIVISMEKNHLEEMFYLYKEFYDLFELKYKGKKEILKTKKDNDRIDN